MFKKPGSWSDFEERVFTNGLYYRTNYLLLAGGISAWWLYVPLCAAVRTRRAPTTPLSRAPHLAMQRGSVVLDASNWL